MLKTILVCIIAGLGAGISTGFAGLSAAVFIAPLLTSVLGMPFFDAIGVALASDVLASAVSAFTYKKNGNLNIKGAYKLLIIILICTILGTIAGYFVTLEVVGNDIMTWWMLLSELGLGISFLVRGQKERKPNPKYDSFRKVFMVLCGMYIGFLCGFQGAGGGLMMLFTLTYVMGYDFKPAVGTSVFMMTFTALIGAASHFAMNGLPDIKIIVITIVATLIAARAAAVVANKVSNKILGRITGITLICTALCILILSPPKFEWSGFTALFAR